MEQANNQMTQERQTNSQGSIIFNERIFCYFYPVFILATPAFLMFPTYEPFEIAENTFHYPYSALENLTEGNGGGVAGVFLAIVLICLLAWAMILPDARLVPAVVAVTSIIIFSLVASRAGTRYDFDLSTNGILILYASIALAIISIGHESTLTYQKYQKRIIGREEKAV